MLAYTSASIKSETGNNTIAKDDIQNELNSSLGQNKATVTSCGKGFDILINDKNYYYTIEEDGTITEPTEVLDIQYAGDITKNGNYDGTTLDKAYRIECIEDLVAFSNDSKTNNFEGLYVVLTRDLNFLSVYSYDNYKTTDFGDLNGKSDDGNELLTEMTTGTGFVPISTFKGNFTTVENEILAIKNIYENRTGDAGLFSTIENAVINNIGVTGKILSSNKAAGIVCYENAGSKITNCYNSINIISSNVSSSVNKGVGGICGYLSNTGYINNCYNIGQIQGSNLFVGGIVGNSKGKIENCYNNAKIEYINGTGTYSGAGGICGGKLNSNLVIKNCYNLSQGTVKSKTSAGGIIGRCRCTGNSNIEIVNCYNLANVTSMDCEVGGIIGDLASNSAGSASDSHIINCFNSGNVLGKFNGRNSR